MKVLLVKIHISSNNNLIVFKNILHVYIYIKFNTV